jgi:hypothetical protein
MQLSLTCLGIVTCRTRYGDRCIYAHDRSEFLRTYKRRSTARLAALKDQGAKPNPKHHRAEFACRPRGRRARGLPLPG